MGLAGKTLTGSYIESRLKIPNPKSPIQNPTSPWFSHF